MPLLDEICAELYAQNSMLPLHYCGFLHTGLSVCGPEAASRRRIYTFQILAVGKGRACLDQSG